MSFLNEILAISKSVDNYEPSCCYVYFGLIDGIPAYVGKGSGSRYKHLLGQKSLIENVRSAQDSGKVFDVYILCDWLSHEEAHTLEKSAIRGLQPTLNREMYH